MPDTLAGFNLQSAGFARTVQAAIHRDVVSLLRAGAVYADPQSVLSLSQVPGSTFVHRATLWTDVPPTLEALDEGVPPSPLKMAEDDLEVTVIEVGDYIPVFSQANYQDGGASKLVMQATTKVARMIFLAFDTLARSVYETATTDAYAGSSNAASADVGAGDVLTTAFVDELVTRARENDLEPFGDGLYRIVGHPRLFKPLLTEAADGEGFAPAANQGTVGDLKKGTIGDYHGAKFVSAGSRGIVLAGAGSTGIDLFKGILIGKQSIALSDMASIQSIIQPGGGPSDPLRQIVATVGFRGFIGGKLVEVANFSDGAGVLDADIRRSVLFEAAGA
jgi:N4-gp56 family major capsid protein